MNIHFQPFMNKCASTFITGENTKNVQGHCPKVDNVLFEWSQFKIEECLGDPLATYQIQEDVCFHSPIDDNAYKCRASEPFPEDSGNVKPGPTPPSVMPKGGDSIHSKDLKPDGNGDRSLYQNGFLAGAASILGVLATLF